MVRATSRGPQQPAPTAAELAEPSFAGPTVASRSGPAGGLAALRRVASLDSLRGFAILLMIADHAGALLGGVRVEPFNLRYFTRFAEPLFAVLFGFMLAGRGRRRLLARLSPLLLAALASNALFASTFHRVDILADFVLIALLYLAVGEWLVLLLPAFLLAAWDPAAKYFDYLPSVVVSQVALGMLIRRSKWGVLGALAFPVATTFVPAGLQNMVLFTLPAALLIALAVRKPGLDVPVVTWLGRRPLSVYVVQFVVLYAVVVAWALADENAWTQRWVLQRLSGSLETVLDLFRR